MSNKSGRIQRENRAFLFTPKSLAFHLGLIAIGLLLRTADLKIMSYGFLGCSLGCAFSILSSKERTTELKSFIPVVIIMVTVSSAATIIFELMGVKI